MKTKDSNFFQQHVEKLILIGCLLALVLIALVYVWGNPYTVMFEGRQYTPGQAPQIPLTVAKRLKHQLDTSNNLVFPKPADYPGQFESIINQPVLSHKQLTAIVPPGLSPNFGHTSYPSFQLPSPPVAGDMKAESGHAVLGKVGDTALRDKWLALMGVTSTPYDFRYVSVAATFDLGAWKDRVMSVPEAKRISSSWFYPAIAGVYLQRQTLNKRTGEWGDTTIIKPLPGRLGFTDAKQDWTLKQADQNREAIKTHQSEVARAPFVPLAYNKQWIPPDMVGPQRSPQVAKKLHESFKKMSRAQRYQKNLLSQIKRVEDRAAKREQNATNNTVLFGGPGGSTNSSLENLSPAEQQKIKNLQKQLQHYRDQIYQEAQTQAQLLGDQQPVPAPPSNSGQSSGGGGGGGGIGPMPGGSGGPGGLSQPPRQPSNNNATMQPQAPPALPQLGPHQWRVWAHDLTAKAGYTYRYRVIVAVLNPLYRRRGVAKAQKQKYYNKFALAPSTTELSNSPWSAPVALKPETYFFFVDGTPGRDQATVKVWRLYNDIWRDGSFDQQPGDEIGGTINLDLIDGNKHPVSFATSDLLVDAGTTGEERVKSRERLLYLDLITGQMERRSLEQDASALQLIRLENDQRLARRRVEKALGIGKNIYGEPRPKPSSSEAGTSGGNSANSKENVPYFKGKGHDPYHNNQSNGTAGS